MRFGEITLGRTNACTRCGGACVVRLEIEEADRRYVLACWNGCRFYL